MKINSLSFLVLFISSTLFPQYDGNISFTLDKKNLSIENIEATDSKGNAIFFVDDFLVSYQNNLTDEKITELLSEHGCLLTRQLGVKGLSLIRENLTTNDKGKKTDTSILANSFCLGLIEDAGQKERYSISLEEDAKYVDVSEHSVALEILNRNLFKACFHRAAHAKYDKEIAGKTHVMNLSTLSAIMTKFFAKELICNELSRYGNPHGNIYKAIFQQKLFLLSDFLIGKIDKTLGEKNSLTIEDISGDDSEFLRRTFCNQLQNDNLTDFEISRIKYYLKRFYGTEVCP